MTRIGYLSAFALLVSMLASGCTSPAVTTPAPGTATPATSPPTNEGTQAEALTLYLPGSLAQDFSGLEELLGEDSGWRVVGPTSGQLEPATGRVEPDEHTGTADREDLANTEDAAKIDAPANTHDDLAAWQRNLAGELTDAQVEEWLRAVNTLAEEEADAFLWVGPSGDEMAPLERRLIARQALAAWAPVLEGPLGLTADDARLALEDAQGTQARESILFSPADQLPSVTVPLRPVRIGGLLPTESNVDAGRYAVTRPVWLVSLQSAPGLGVPAGAAKLGVPAGAAKLGVAARAAEPGASAGRVGEPEAPVRAAEPGASAEVAAAPDPLATLKAAVRTHLYPEQQATLRFSAVGDVMLSRGVEGRMNRLGAEYPFARTAARLKAADLTFANLESPFTTRGEPIPKKLIWFRTDPKYVGVLHQAGIDLLTLANNHILDYDTQGLLDTFDTLDQAGIDYFGAGRNREEAHTPKIIERNGIRLAFLGYSAFAEIFWSWDYRRTFEATDELPGVAPLNPQRFAEIEEDIRRAREEADLVIVAYHWGTEYLNHPDKINVQLAHATIDAGADMVLGAHPHAIQGLEYYKGKLIAYSLGNFVMDQERERTTESLILEMTLTADGPVVIDPVPVKIVAAQPRVLTDDEAEWLLGKLRRISPGGFPRPGVEK